MIKINEIFASIQGEGSWVGTPVTFIRFAECNLKCSWCDTDFSIKKEMSREEIVKVCKENPATHIVLTGGEVMLQAEEAHLLTYELKTQLGYKVAVETNGTIGIKHSLFDLITVSPKINIGVEQVECDDLKVVYEGQDLKLYEDIFKVRNNYYLQPLDDGSGTLDNAKEVAEIIANNWLWRLSLQTHKILCIK